MTHSRPNEFIPPPECPVFEPSWEEFADPFGFINKIRPIAENTGICKIRPPPGWQPPFACDVDRLHFTPRIQRLNELETRVKLNFLDQIAKFWELQGCTLKIPHVERKTLDLYVLYKLVKEEGGFDVVCKERRWTQIALRMGFAPGKAVGSHLRAHYERILYPYYLFQTGANLMNSQKPTLTNDTKDKEYKPHDLPQRQSVQPVETCTIARRAKRTKGRCFKSEPGEVCENKPNLRRRMGSYVAKPESVMTIPVQVKEEPIEQQVEGEKSKVEQYMCLVCGGGGDEDRLLLCDGCDDSYHTFCLIPPLHDVPKGDWRCPKCLAQECGKPQVAFGFEQASRDYTLRTFGDMADSFKSDYFNMPVHMVPTELVEKEFWRLVSTIEEDVTVEYGADIASKDFGSGFPVKNGTFKVSPEEEDYLSSGWNLNNMPVLDASVLTHVTADICGMKLPWLYVGMCFSSFCWHIEDHWSYSINYLHWGEPKTWYGAPGYAAEQLENVMKNLAPELFESQPDLLHQLVTIMNPNVLMEHGVPIYRTNQCAGEFVITFPRSYHSGFNQGFNFAEAVNFCTADWMPLGRQCVEHYRSLNRYCVFSHDEMTCNIAAKADSLELELASAVQKDMCAMILEEKMLRERAYKLGVWHSQQVDYDLLADEERQCAKCRTTCYLSAITCPCSPDQLVCLHHIEDLCSCPARSYTLNYKFTLAELKPLFQALTARAESYEDWASKVNKILKADHDNKSDLEELRSLIVEAEKKTYPETDLLSHLRQVIQNADRCTTMAQQLLNGKRQTRYCVFSHDEMTCNIAAKADSLELELASAVQKDMCAMILEEKMLRERAYKLGVWHSQQVDYDLLADEERQCAKCRTTCYLSAITCPCSPDQLVCLHHIEDLCSCPARSYTLNYKFTLAELKPLFQALTARAESYEDWASKVNKILKADHDNKSDLEELRSLIVEAEKKTYPETDLLSHLRQVIQNADRCTTMAQQLLNGKRQTRYRSGGGKSQNQLTVEELRSFVNQLYDLPCTIRQAPFLKALLNRVEQFQQQSTDLLAEDMPGSSALQALLDEGAGLDVELPQLAVLRQRLEQARWVEAVQEASDQPADLSLDCMRRLIDQGVGLAPHACVERTMARLQELLTVCEHWEEKAHNMLTARPRHSIETLEAAIQEVDSIPAYLPSCIQLKDCVSRAREWIMEADALQAGGRIPGLAALTELVARARGIPVMLEPLTRLESLVSEVLCPRCETGPQKSKSKKPKDASVPCKKVEVKLDSLFDVEKALSTSKDTASAMATLSDVHQKELESLSMLRTSNESKFQSSPSSVAPTVCLCHTVPAGPMLQCELCRDAYHSGCVPGFKDIQTGLPWLCPLCKRSEKPPLDKVLPLLASLQRIRVRLPEGDALRYVIERTVRWQHKVQQVLPIQHPNGKARNISGIASSQTLVGSNSSFYMLQPCIPLNELSAELEDLLVEGLLQQVTLPELQPLYSSLLNRFLPSQNSLQSSEHDHQYHIAQDRSPPHRSPPHSKGQDAVPETKKEPEKLEKNSKRRLEKENMEGQQRDKIKKPKKKKPKMNKERRREEKQTTSPSNSLSDLSYSDDSEEDWSVCSAKQCQQPEGNEVNWVQCDGSCNQWFHQICVGVSAEQAENEDYICVSCAINDLTE
ncbi:lysine-specific demethylase 5B-like protein [Labeo rohita]|uniref:[histone H3]-trimethyl-L-lysine(4) demethylase n=1 Tax=Labeo rohita TaxID=84645 RepID=A0A498P2G9_LABRO|nr:lysine-specific demethylase 5B-like protein [Labeo rohita]